MGLLTIVFKYVVFNHLLYVYIFGAAQIFWLSIYTSLSVSGKPIYVFVNTSCMSINNLPCGNHTYTITALFRVHAFLNRVLMNSWPSSRGKNQSKMAFIAAAQVTMFTVCSVKAFIALHRTKLVATIAMQYKTFEHCNCNDYESHVEG